MGKKVKTREVVEICDGRCLQLKNTGTARVAALVYVLCVDIMNEWKGAGAFLGVRQICNTTHRPSQSNGLTTPEVRLSHLAPQFSPKIHYHLRLFTRTGQLSFSCLSTASSLENIFPQKAHRHASFTSPSSFVRWTLAKCRSISVMRVNDA